MLRIAHLRGFIIVHSRREKRRLLVLVPVTGTANTSKKKYAVLAPVLASYLYSTLVFGRWQTESSDARPPDHEKFGLLAFHLKRGTIFSLIIEEKFFHSYVTLYLKH